MERRLSHGRQRIDQLLEVVLADVSRAHLVGIDQRLCAQEAHQKLLSRHFQAEDADGQSLLQGDVLRDVQRQRGFTHRGPGSNDQRHRFVCSGVWELDYARKLGPVGRAILGGWQLSGILTAQSGQPYSGLVGFDLNNDGNALSDRTPGQGRNTLYLPATVSLDPRVTRSLQMGERTRLHLSWEAFNVLNRSNITGVQTTQFARSLSTSACGIAGAPCLVPQNAFGTPNTSSGPRIMQFSARLTF